MSAQAWPSSDAALWLQQTHSAAGPAKSLSEGKVPEALLAMVLMLFGADSGPGPPPLETLIGKQAFILPGRHHGGTFAALSGLLSLCPQNKKIKIKNLKKDPPAREASAIPKE